MAKKSKKSSLYPQLTRPEILILSLFFLATTILYINNLTRDIYSGDVGDLVTAAYVFGVAHPPGYPLFTFLGFLLSHLPLPLPIVSRVGLLSVFASLLALFFFYKLAYRLTKHFYISLLSTSILAFSYYFWLHAELPEVFGLNHLFVIAILYVATLFYQEKRLFYFYLLGFLTGLSLTHHHIILFVLPTALLLILKHIKLIFSHWKIPLIGIGCLLLGLLPYLYVPIASSMNPVINWDNVKDWNSFVHLVLRKDYGFAPTIQGTTPVPIKVILVKDYLKTLVDNYSYQIVFVGLLGVAQLFRKDKWLTSVVFFGFLFAGPVFIFYAAPPVSTIAKWGIIERFYSFSMVLFLFFVPSGFLLIKKFFDSRFSNKLYSSAILLYFLIIPMFMLYYNFPKTDLSNTRIGNNLADDVLSSLPKNAVLQASGDTTLFNIWYAHYVLGKRPDVGLVNPPGVGGNRFLDEEINKYKSENPEVSVSEVLSNTLTELRNEREFYTTFEKAQREKGTVLLPKGMIYQIIDKDEIPNKDAYIADVEKHLKKLHIARNQSLSPAEVNLITTEIPLIYSNALVRVGDFMMQEYKDYAMSEHYYRRALWINDTNPSAYSGLALAQFHGAKDCSSAIENMKTAIEYYKVWKQYYVQLHALYGRCNVNEDIVKEFKDNYKNEFNVEFDTDTKPAQ